MYKRVRCRKEKMRKFKSIDRMNSTYNLLLYHFPRHGQAGIWPNNSRCPGHHQCVHQDPCQGLQWEGQNLHVRSRAGQTNNVTRPELTMLAHWICSNLLPVFGRLLPWVCVDNNKKTFAEMVEPSGERKILHGPFNAHHNQWCRRIVNVVGQRGNWLGEQAYVYLLLELMACTV